MKRFKHIALGGTFDRIHIGHHHLINVAAKRSERLTIGLTTNKLTASKQFHHNILSYNLRLNQLQSYLSQIKKDHLTSIIPLTDIYGTTLNDKSIDAIAVTPQTKKGAQAINASRKKLNLPPLPIVTASLIKDEDGVYISSTKIRQGSINRLGHVHKNIFNKNIVFNDTQKKIIKSPQGKLLITPSQIADAFSHQNLTTLVGDVITQYAIDNNLKFDHAIVDYMNNRQPFDLKLKQWKPFTKISAINPPGAISANATKKIHKALQSQSSLVEVDGEEDLLGFPAALFLPLGSRVFYGQPQEGVVMIEVTEDAKSDLVSILNRS